jgi:hypothetical protein
MTSGCPPSCRPMLFALRSLRSFVAAFVSVNLRQSADPQPSFVAFVASCEISLFARDLRSPHYLNPCICVPCVRWPLLRQQNIILKEPEIRGDPS